MPPRVICYIELDEKRYVKDQASRQPPWYLYDIPARRLRLCRSYDVSSDYPQTSTGKIVAIPDLANSRLVVAFISSYSRASPPDLSDVRDQFEFDYLFLGMSGREFRIRGQLLEKYQTRGRMRYAYTFPANLETGHGRSEQDLRNKRSRIRGRGETTSKPR